FGGVKTGVNAAEHNVGAAFASDFPNFVTAPRIGGVDADTDNIPSLNVERVHCVQSFIDQAWVAKACRRGRRQNVQPARCNDSRTERNFARINEMNAHSVAPPQAVLHKQGKESARNCILRITKAADLLNYEFRSAVRRPILAGMYELLYFGAAENWSKLTTFRRRATLCCA